MNLKQQNVALVQKHSHLSFDISWKHKNYKHSLGGISFGFGTNTLFRVTSLPSFNTKYLQYFKKYILNKLFTEVHMGNSSLN